MNALPGRPTVLPPPPPPSGGHKPQITVVLGGTIVRPGETLVLTTSRRYSAAEVDEMGALLRERFPHLGEVLIINDVTGVAVFPPREQP